MPGPGWPNSITGLPGPRCGDGIADKDDKKCPDVAGLAKYQGLIPDNG